MKINRKIILASASPRRYELLKQIKIEFETHTSQFQEKEEAENPEELVLYNAEGKAQEVSKYYENAIIIGVDTIGVCENEILLKPKDQEDSKRILKMLSGTSHKVISGICLIDSKTGRELTKTESTKVTIDDLSDLEIDEYIASGEGSDKAAGYAIQGIGAKYVKSIEGDYFNVVGLPINTLYKMLGEIIS